MDPLLESAGSTAVMRGLSCSATGGIFPDQGIHTSRTGRWILTQGAPREAPNPHVLLHPPGHAPDLVSAGQGRWVEEPEAPSAQWEG